MTSARATLALAVALVLAAVTFDSSALYVPGIGLLLAYAAARLWVWLAARQARLDQRPGPRTVVEGEHYPLDIEVRSGALPIPGGTVTHPLAASPVPLGRRTPARASLGVASLRRGWREIEPVTLRVEDPLRLTAAQIEAVDSHRVLVLPRVEPVVFPEDALDGADESSRIVAGTPRGDGLGKRTVASEMDGLRSYRPGSPASRIHWPILARTGELVERRLVGGTNASPVVALDAGRPADADALDRAVRAAASLCVHLAPGAGCMLLLPEARVPHRIDPGLRLWPRAHARLAVVDGGGGPLDHRAVSRDAAVFWVSANTEAPRLAPGLAALVCYLVTPSPLPGRDPLFTVAGCHGHRVAAKTRRVAPAGRAA